MPVMNGFEATRAIRALENERGRTTPAVIVALTGLGSDRDIEQAHDAGVDLFLTKPVSFRVINKLIDDTIVRRAPSLPSTGVDALERPSPSPTASPTVGLTGRLLPSVSPSSVRPL